MTLTSVIVVLTLFAYASGLITGVAVTQGWYEHRAGELAGLDALDEEDAP